MCAQTTHEWWGVSSGVCEDCCTGCLAVGNLDNTSDGMLKVATGSYSGLLRVYQPHEPVFRVEDVMLETLLDAPILQLACAQLLSDSNRIALAVLHPHSFAVYSLSAVASSAPGCGKDVPYFKLTLAYEHALDRPAFNFVHGPFGGTIGHDLVCVQSMDGRTCPSSLAAPAAARTHRVAHVACHLYPWPRARMLLRVWQSSWFSSRIVVSSSASWGIACYQGR